MPASCVKEKLRKFCWELDGEKYRIGNVCLFIENKDYSYRYAWMTFSGQQKLSSMRKKLMKSVDLGEPTSFLDHVYLGCT